MIVLGLGVIGAVAWLSARATASTRAELTVNHAKLRLWEVDNAAWSANADVQGSPASALQKITSGEQALEKTLATLRRTSDVSALNGVPTALQANLKITYAIYSIGSTRGYGPWINAMGAPQNETQAEVNKLLDQASREYATDASNAKRLALIGSSVAILLLLAAFVFLYGRAARARSTAEELAEQHRNDALTDALTGLGNRRALIEDLETAASGADGEQPLLVAILDLDGFKQYNDTFGHAAGDALLTRLAHRLLRACEGRGAAYRMGGDEFCIVASEDSDSQDLLDAAAEALSEDGEQWTVTCSSGLVRIPSEATTASEALRIADIRMYAQKAGRASAGRQATDALLAVLSAQDPDTHLHAWRVARLARATGEALGLDDPAVNELGTAAELHDIGKAAIPATVLSKPGPLDPEELALMRRHTILGERIMMGAPSLTGAARLVRHSHERVDGTGYPDGLAGEQIPVESRIISVCEAFDAMTSERPYARTLTDEEATAELKRCAGTQFDPRVVEAFCEIVAFAATEETSVDDAAAA